MPPQNILSSIQVDPREFENYKSRINKGFEEYMKNKKQILQQQFNHQVNLEEVLNLCYQSVPEYYFKDDFVFNFNQLSRVPLKMNSIHNNLSEHLDEVEINLFYQIYNRFNEFLTVILNLNQMGNAIDDALFKINSLKKFNKTLKQKSIQSGLKIVILKKKIDNFEKSLGIMESLKTVHKAIPAIYELVQSGRFEHAVELLKESEEIYNNQFKNLKALSHYKETIAAARQKLDKIITTNFQDKSLDYVSVSLNFSKGSDDLQKLDESSYILNSQLLNDTFEQNKLNVSILEEHSKNCYLSWNHVHVQRDLQKEQQISKIVLQAFSFGQLSAMNFRAKLIEVLRNFHKQIQNDMKEYCEQVLQKNNISYTVQDDVFQLINPDLFIKLVIFYADILKGVIRRQLQLNNTVVNNLIVKAIADIKRLYQDQYDDYQNDIEDEEELKLGIDQDQFGLLVKLKEIIEEFYQIIIHIFKFVNDKFVSLINVKKLYENTSIPHFKRLNNIFSYWDSFVEVECQKLMKIQQEQFKLVKSQKLQDLIIEFSNYYQKIPLNGLNNLRSEKEKIFIGLYHKQEVQKLRQELEIDKWTPSDIPFEFYDILQYILNEKQQQFDNQENLDQSHYLEEGDNILMTQSKTFDMINTDRPICDDLITPRSSLQDKENQSQMMNGENQKEQNEQNNNKNNNNNNNKQQFSIRIIQNQLILNNNKFKLTHSYLQMIKQIYNYLHLIQYLKTIRNETVKNLFELLKFFNSYSTQLIIGRGGLSFEHLKRITSKHLAISSLNLFFSLEIFDQIGQRIKQNFEEKAAFEWIDKEIDKLKLDYFNHQNEIFNTISTILTDKMNKSCQDLRQLQWNNQQEKFHTPTKLTSSILENMRIMYLAIEDFYNQNQLKRIFEKNMNEMNEIYLKVFKDVEINTKLGAKRLKDELEYVSQDVCSLGFIEYLQDQKHEFENNIQKIIEEKCLEYLEDTNQ